MFMYFHFMTPDHAFVLIPEASTQRVQFLDIHEGVEATKSRKQIDDEQKDYFIKNRYPGSAYQFPAREYNDKSRKTGKVKRYCSHDWFRAYDFLSYSKDKDGLFCLCCALFPVDPHHGERAKLLITTPYRNWKDATADLNKHATLEYHKDSYAKMKAFISSMERPHSRVDQILSTNASETIQRNRRFLESIIRCIETCGRQGIALRGHRDDGLPSDEECHRNIGNFKALIKLVSRTDEDLRSHLDTCKKTASYISKTTQNDLLQCIMDFIQERIAEEIKSQDSGPYYGLIADEVTDCSNWEQLGVVVRYLKNDEPIERLVEYIKCENIRGETIAQHIIDCVTKLGLDVNKCRSQTYDGAGNMAGKQKGAAQQFQDKTGNTKATYFHCASHELNLALSKASKVPEVHNLVCLMQSIGIFFQFSAKRTRELEKSIDEICKKNGNNPNLMKKRLKPLCETRWVERHTSFSDLETLYEHLMHCLDTIELNEDTRWDPKSVTEASGLNSQIRSSKFIVSFTSCRYIFGYTQTMSRLLQGTSMDLVTAFNHVENVTKELEAVRNNAEEEFSRLYASSCDMAKVAGQTLTKPRVVLRQTLRSNVEAATVEDYYRKSIFVPFVDNLTTQLRDRFQGRSHAAVKALYLLPNSVKKINQEIEQAIKSCYEDDLPSASAFQQEVRLWCRYWESESNLPSSLSETLKIVKSRNVHQLYPNIVTIFRILLTFSATSASVERSNSALRFIKSTYRSTMGEDRFNALILLFVHRDIALDYDKIIDKYARRYPRRMLFANPLLE